MKEDFTTIKKQLPGICRIASDFYLTPKRKGINFFVKSPVAYDKTWSLVLYPNNNRFCDFANGGFSGDSIAFVAYIKKCNQWQALKELQTFYGLVALREQDKQEVQRKIRLQQEQDYKKKERQQAFRAALYGEINSLKRWVDINRAVIEKCLYEPFTDEWCYCVEESQKAEAKLDVLCGVPDMYWRMKPNTERGMRSDRYQWILDCLGVLQQHGAFTATERELKEIKAQRDFELIRKPGTDRRCGIEW